MKATEYIIVAALSAIMAAVGIKALSPEAQEMADTIQHAARVQDWKWDYASEISGRDYFEGLASLVDVTAIAVEIRETGGLAGEQITENPEVQAEAAAAVTRWNVQ